MAKASKKKAPSTTWLEQEVDIEQLTPFERNPRRISVDAYDQLVKSLQENGYHQRIITTRDYRVIGGHQRIRALKDLGFSQVKILVPDRDIDDETFKRMLIQDNLPFGEFDFDILSADYEADQLLEWGMPAEWLPKAPDFAPAGEEEQGKLDEKKQVTCPECGHRFDPTDER